MGTRTPSPKWRPPQMGTSVQDRKPSPNGDPPPQNGDWTPPQNGTPIQNRDPPPHQNWDPPLPKQGRPPEGDAQPLPPPPPGMEATPQNKAPPPLITPLLRGLLMRPPSRIGKSHPPQNWDPPSKTEDTPKKGMPNPPPPHPSPPPRMETLPQIRIPPLIAPLLSRAGGCLFRSPLRAFAGRFGGS